MRIGVLGGSFDPVHNAHLIVAQLAREQLALDHVHFIVAAEQPFKQGAHRASATDRFEMVRLAVAGIPGLIADDRELHRTGPSYTIDTLRELATEFAGSQLVLLLGADAAAGFTRWREPDAIAALATVAVCRRAADGPAATPIMTEFLVPALEISSTGIRARAGRGDTVSGWVPSAVADYIVASQLYRSGSE